MSQEEMAQAGTEGAANAVPSEPPEDKFFSACGREFSGVFELTNEEAELLRSVLARNPVYSVGFDDACKAAAIPESSARHAIIILFDHKVVEGEKFSERDACLIGVINYLMGAMVPLPSAKSVISGLNQIGDWHRVTDLRAIISERAVGFTSTEQQVGEVIYSDLFGGVSEEILVIRIHEIVDQVMSRLVKIVEAKEA